MNIVDLLANAHGGRGLESIGRQFGLDESQTRAAVDALAPVVAAGLRRNTQSNDGLADLIGALVQGNHGRYVEDASAVQFDRVSDDGNAILGHIFGSKDVSRGVAQQAAGLSGIGNSILKKMLPVIASMVIGALAKQMLGGGRGAAQPRQADAGGGGLGDILGDILGGGGRQQPSSGQQMPPGGLEDILKDILGGGAATQQRPTGQGMPPGGLNDILKDIFGGGPASGGGQPRPQSEEIARRTRGRLDDMLGGGSRGGSAADDLLNSVERAIRGGR
jgi:hypothetical protein